MYNEALVEVFYRNSRMPEWFQSDLVALVTACKTAASRVCEVKYCSAHSLLVLISVLQLCDRYGFEVYTAATGQLLDQNKEAIAEIINTKIGTEKSSFTDFIDDDGNGNGPYAISCTMQKVGNKLVFDWDGTSPQSNTSMNYYLSRTM